MLDQKYIEEEMKIMTLAKKQRPKKKLHQLELNLMDAFAHPDDGEQRKRYIKRFLYGEASTKKKLKSKQSFLWLKNSFKYWAR